MRNRGGSRSGVGRLVVLGVVVALSACSSETSLSTAAAEPVVATSAAVGEPTHAAAPMSTAGLAQASAVVEGSLPSSGPSQQAVGVVVAVDGDLSEIRAFSLLLSDGAVLDLVPQAGLLFDGGPLSHLRDHLLSGVPVAVEFHVEAGVAIVTGVGDAQ